MSNEMICDVPMQRIYDGVFHEVKNRISGDDRQIACLDIGAGGGGIY
jgi:hypothetical protein